MTNLHPIFDRLLSRTDKESKLQQHGRVLWFTGLSGSGKSTIAEGLEKKLFAAGFAVQILDGDNIRTGLCNNLGFTLEDRRENIRRIAELAKLFAQSGIICLCSFVSPTQEIRQLAAEIIGDDFLEIYVDTPIEICELRDVKGLYKKARAGEIENFTGISSPYEAPESPFLVLETRWQSALQCVELAYTAVLDEIIY